MLGPRRVLHLAAGRKAGQDHLVRLGEAADTAGHHVRNLYVTFLTIGVYIAIAVGSTTHEQLLRKSALELPIFKVGLPLLGFYIVVPILFLLFHFHLLLQFYLLSRKLFALDDALRALPKPQADERRGMLFPLAFSHRLLGKHLQPDIWLILSFVIVATLAVLPVLLLLVVQLRFLPYHSPLMTWVHRLCITADLLMLWYFWPLIHIREADGTSRWKWFRAAGESASPQDRLRRAIFYFYVAGAFAVSIFGLAVPGEPADLMTHVRPGSDRLHYRNLYLPGRTLVLEPPAPEIVAAYEATGKDAATAWTKYAKGLDLAGRDLRYANLDQTRLTGANLRNAKMQGVHLFAADLQRANLRVADLQGADLTGAWLQGANLSRAFLDGADCQGAHLSLADLWKVSLVLLTDEEWLALREQLSEQAPVGKRRDEALERIARASKRKSAFSEPSWDEGQGPLHDGQGPFADWPVPDKDVYYRNRSASLVEAACSDRWIARGIARRVTPVADIGPLLDGPLGRALLAAECPAVKQALEELREAALPSGAAVE